MSIKYFCDKCKKEITAKNSVPGGGLKTQNLGALSIEIITSLGSCANAGHWCKYCIIDEVNTLDDRPKAL